MTGGLDVSALAPSDAVAALRSFPRRFRAVLTAEGPEDAARVDAALPEVDVAGRDLAVLGQAVQRALLEDRPTLHPAVLDPSARHYPDHEVTAEAALDLLTLEAEALADRASSVAAAEWGRVAVVPGQNDASALDLLREAVRTTADHLRAAEAAR